MQRRDRLGGAAAAGGSVPGLTPPLLRELQVSSTGEAPAQGEGLRPCAARLRCADSRVDPAWLFACGAGELQELRSAARGCAALQPMLEQLVAHRLEAPSSVIAEAIAAQPRR